MTKRYRVFKIDNRYGVSDDIANYTLAWDTSKTIMDGLCDKLNEQDQRIQELEELNTQLCNFNLHIILDKKNKEINQLKQEKERYKRLSEIRNEQINNRILTIREFIDNCLNEDVKNALQDLFYSEVNEYDLAKENRKLVEENDSLKKWIEMIGEK